MSKSSLPQKAPNGFFMDNRRRAMIARGSFINHGDAVIETDNQNFDITKTIFKNLAPELHDLIRKQYGVLLFWNDTVVRSIAEDVSNALEGCRKKIK